MSMTEFEKMQILKPNNWPNLIWNYFRDMDSNGKAWQIYIINFSLYCCIISVMLIPVVYLLKMIITLFT